MKKYQAVRISVNGIPTYSGIYMTVIGNYEINQIVDIGNSRAIIIFEEVIP